MLKLYTRPGHSNSDHARNLLEERRADFKEIIVDPPYNPPQELAQHGWTGHYPAVFDDQTGRFVEEPSDEELLNMVK